VARAGTGGSDGFEWFGASVDNVSSEWFGHSDSLMRPHIENKWLPVLCQPPSPLAILHGRDIQDRNEFSKTLDHTGTVIDAEVFGKLAHYDEVEIPRGLSLMWIRVNPDIYTFLIDRQTRKPAGYINAMPVDDTLYAKIRTGSVADNKVLDASIVPFLGVKTIKIYLMSIAIGEEYRRWGDGILQQASVKLLTGFLDKLIYYAKNRGIRATHFIATAWTPEGRRMCEFFAMKEVGKDTFGDSIFELELEALQSSPSQKLSPPLKRLLKVYKEIRSSS
jgi:hypothetical protein